jgi:hypothetical protein
MRLSNLESMLETSTQKAKQDEKEIRKLQYGERGYNFRMIMHPEH